MLSPCGVQIQMNWQPPYFAEELIWKRSFVSTVRPIIHANPSCTKTKLFKKRTLDRSKFFVFAWTKPSFPHTQIQNARLLLRLESLRRSANGKHLMCSQSETSVFKYRRRSMHQGQNYTHYCSHLRLSGLVGNAAKIGRTTYIKLQHKQLDQTRSKLFISWKNKWKL